MKCERTDSYEYEIKQETATILRYIGHEAEVQIPETLGGCPVVKIGAEAFYDGGMGITSIDVPGTVRDIEHNAFEFCINLQKLNLHTGLRHIGTDFLLLAAQVRELTIPDTVSDIEQPSDLGDLIWHIDAGNPYYSTDGYALYRTENGQKTLAAVQLQDERTEYDIEENTVKIGSKAFQGQEYLKTLYLPKHVSVIGEKAFNCCKNLCAIHFNHGLLEIGKEAFRRCTALKEIRLPDSVSRIGEGAFDTFDSHSRERGLVRIKISEKNPHFRFDGKAFFCYLANGQNELLKYFGSDREYSIPSGVNVIGQSAFRGAGFKKLTFPATVRKINKDVLKDCENLQYLVLKRDGSLLYIPQISYRKDKILRLLTEPNAEAVLDFHYAAYDDLFKTYSNLEDRLHTACCRLLTPVALSQQNRELYQHYLADNLPAILHHIAQREDTSDLAVLADLGLFTAETIDKAIDSINLSGKTALLAFLMEYKHTHFPKYDFRMEL